MDLIGEVTSMRALRMCAKNGMIPLGELRARLEAMPQDKSVVFDDGNIPIDIDSYRGYYEHVAIEPGSKNERTTVGDLLRMVKRAIGGTFRGYKGGEFEMTSFTPVWYSEWGRASGVGVVGIEDRGDTVVLLTSLTEDRFKGGWYRAHTGR